MENQVPPQDDAAAAAAAAAGAPVPPAAGANAAGAQAVGEAILAQFGPGGAAALGGGGRARAKPPTLDKVSGREWLAFIRRFELTSTINQWGDARAAMELAVAMTGDAQRAVAGLPVEGVAYLVLRESYRAIFLPAAASDMAVSAFETARQREGEDFLQWHARLRDLFQQAYPEQADWNTARPLIRRYACNLRHPQIMDHVLTRRPDTYAEALTLSQDRTATLALLPGFAKRSLGIHSMDQGPDDGVNASGPGGRGACFECGDLTHQYRQCPKWKAKGRTTPPAAAGGRRAAPSQKGSARGKKSRQPGRARVSAMADEPSLFEEAPKN